MTSVSLNFDGVEPAQPFTPVDDGQYNLVISDAKIQPNKKDAENNPPSLALTFDVEGHPNNKVWHYLYLGDSDINKKYILQFLLSLFGGNLSTLDITFNDEFAAGIVGMPMLAIVENVARDDKPDKRTNKITSFEVSPL